MKLKTLAILVAVLAVLSAIVYQVNRPERPAASDPRVGKPVADAASVEKAQKMRLSDQGKTMVFTRLPDGTWKTDYHGFQADISKLSGFVADLTNAKIDRLVTTNPARVARLEFKDTKVEFLDAADHPVWSITLGKVGESGGRFLRYDDEPKAYFATLNLWLDMDPKGWTNTVLTDVKPDDIAKIEIPTDQGPVVVSRAKKDDAWTSDKTPAGQQVKADKVATVASTIGSLRFSDTADLGDAKAAEAKSHLRTYKLTTFDGKTISVAIGRKPEEKKLKAAGSTPPAPLVGPDGKPATSSKPPGPEFETVPAGPIFVWVTNSDAKAPVNALMKQREFQVEDYVGNGLPQKADELFEPLPPPPPKKAEDKKP